MKTKIGLSLMVLMTALSIVPPAHSDDSDGTRETLRGLPGIGVAITTEVDEYLEKRGLSEMDIEAEVILKLKLAGIPILTPQEVGQTRGWPHLQVSLMAERAEAGQGYAYAVFIELLQGVQLHQNPGLERILAPTWSSAYSIGYIDSHQVRDVRQVVASELNRFIQAYKSVNPTGKTPL